jgi:two-component system, NtrC family, sensor kinase
MRIGTVLLVGVENPLLARQLEKQGYETLAAPTAEAVMHVDASFDLMIIDERFLHDVNTDAAERLYFMNNSVPTTVLIRDPGRIDASLRRIVCEGTIEPLYDHEIESGFAASRIDRIFITAQFNKNLESHQRSSHEKEILKKELSLREQILTHERLLNTNIIASITAGLMIIDAAGTIVLVNSHVSDLFSFIEADVIGAEYARVLPEEAGTVVKTLLSELDTGTAPHVLTKAKIGNRFLEFSGYRMRDNQNSVVGALVLIQDVSEQENVAVQLFRAEKLATVGTMLSGIAHELRNPLAIISARAQRAMARETFDAERARKGFESVEAQAQRCASIVNSLLDFTRQTATKTGYHKVAEILDETLTYVQYQNVFDNIAVTKRYESDLLVYGDRSRFVQVFLNLITNAADAMDGRGVLSITTSSAGALSSLVEINDTGPGIDPAIAGKIFDPFFTTKDTGKGTGLGLAIVYKIVQQSGGSIWFASRPGSTSFFVNLPTVKERSHA